jgi:hypothetical protein
MATRIDLLVEAYEKVVKEPWSSALSGQERIWFLVYDPAEQRKIELRHNCVITKTADNGTIAH